MFGNKIVGQDFNTENTEGTEDTEKRKSGKFVALDRKSPPFQTKGGAPSSSIVGRRNKDRRAQAGMPVPQRAELLVFLVDVEDGAVFVEGYVEGFGFFYEDVGELVFLG